MIAQPPFEPPTAFTDPQQALAHAQRIYATSLAHLRQGLRRYIDTPASAWPICISCCGSTLWKEGPMSPACSPPSTRLK